MPLLNKPLVSSANFQRTEQEIGSLQKEIAANQQATTSSSVPAPAVPLPCTGGAAVEQCNPAGFLIAFQIDKKGEFDTFCAMIPAGCTRLGTLLGKTVDQGIRRNTLFHWVDVPEDIAATGGHFEYMFPLNLKYNTQYGLIQLIAVVEDPVTGLVGRKKNPAKAWNAQTQQYSYLATWTTGNALNGPSAPQCPAPAQQVGGDVTVNQIYVDHDGGHAQLSVRAYFDGGTPGRQKTADQMEATVIGVRLKNANDGTLIRASTPVVNGSDIFEDVQFTDVPEGLQVFLHDVWISHGTGKTFSPAVDCGPITCGATNTDPTAFANMVNGASLTFAAVDGKHSLATLSYTQPTQPFAVKKIQILRSDNGAAGPFNIEVPADRPIAEGVTNPGIQTAKYLVKTKVANSGTWKVRMLARPGLDVTGSGTFTSNGVADATGDLGPAGPVQNFTATWEASNVTFKWKLPATNSTSIVNYNIWATDLMGTVFMQVLSDGTTKAGQRCVTQSKAGSLVQSGHHLTTKIKLRLLDAAFAAGFIIRVSANNYVNGVLTEGTEADFTVTPGVDYLDSNDAVNVTSAGQSVFSTRNELFNGHFHYSRGSGVCRHWSSNRLGGNWIPPAPSGTGLEFDAAFHCLHWFGAGGGLPVQQLGDPSQQTAGYNVDAGDYKTVSFVLFSLNGQHTLSLQVAVRDNGGNPVAVVPFSATVNSTPSVFQVKFQVPPNQSFAPGGSFFLQFEDPALDITSVSDLRIDVVGMNAGQRYTGYALNPNDTNNAGNQTWDAPPSSLGVLTSPPVSPTGPAQGQFTQGGEPAVGSGGAPRFFQ
jgi:hypothetical protein